jgi:hypothetical protein
LQSIPLPLLEFADCRIGRYEAGRKPRRNMGAADCRGTKRTTSGEDKPSLCATMETTLPRSNDKKHRQRTNGDARIDGIGSQRAAANKGTVEWSSDKEREKETTQKRWSGAVASEEQFGRNESSNRVSLSCAICKCHQPRRERIKKLQYACETRRRMERRENGR